MGNDHFQNFEWSNFSNWSQGRAEDRSIRMRAIVQKKLAEMKIPAEGEEDLLAKFSEWMSSPQPEISRWDITFDLPSTPSDSRPMEGEAPSAP